MSTSTPLKSYHWMMPGTPVPTKENTIVAYKANANMTVIRAVTPKHVHQYIEHMGLHFSKYNTFKVYKQKQTDPSTLIELKEMQRSNNHCPSCLNKIA